MEEPVRPGNVRPDDDAFAAAWAEVGRRFAEARALRSSPAWDQLPRP